MENREGLGDLSRLNVPFGTICQCMIRVEVIKNERSAVRSCGGIEDAFYD